MKRKLQIRIKPIKQYDGEYYHDVVLLGIEYSQGSFEYGDHYNQIVIGLIFFKIEIAIQ